MSLVRHELKRPCLPARSAMLRPGLTDSDDVTARSSDKHPTSRMIQRLASVTRRCAATSRYRQLFARYRNHTVAEPAFIEKVELHGTLRGDCWLCTRLLTANASTLEVGSSGAVPGGGTQVALEQFRSPCPRRGYPPVPASENTHVQPGSKSRPVSGEEETAEGAILGAIVLRFKFICANRSACG